MEIAGYLVIGFLAGCLSGLVGVGGGVIVIPALTFLFAYSQKTAQGTSLAMMIPPVGLLAAVQYYRGGFMNLKAAVLLALAFAVGAWLVSLTIARIPTVWLERAFGLYLLFVAGSYITKSSGGKPGMIVWGLASSAAFALGWKLKTPSKSAKPPLAGPGEGKQA
jgi:hypothetical protein